jgi:23S rRNA (cytidine1920-2'-O)/16S rRNA (cytidine1409-2'-O)-methyltransferase
MRADQLLVLRGLASSRSQAVRLIESGARWRRATDANGEWRVLRKSDDLADDSAIELADAAEAKYVSRGGLKLEGALRDCGMSVAGLRCLDVGQSTGGFTDCLLQHGAAHVQGIDVGHGQLHPRLRSDPRVLCMEKVNARQLQLNQVFTPQLIAHYDHMTLTLGSKTLKTSGLQGSEPAGKQAIGFDLIVGDLSFISQTLVWPALQPLLAVGAALLMLVKPQFELQPEHIGKGGIVRDAAFYPLVEQRMRSAAAELGLEVKHYINSPITGGDGNREFFIHAVKTGVST